MTTPRGKDRLPRSDVRARRASDTYELTLAPGGVLADSYAGLEVTIGTGLQNAAGTLTTKDSEIVHDNLSGFVADEHIDWTDTTENLKTTGTGQFAGGLVDGSDALSIDTGARYLYWPAGAAIALNWASGDCNDSLEVLSIAWSNRYLYADNGSDVILDWSTVGLAEFGNTNLITTGLITTGNLDVDTLNLNANVISDSTGTISFDNEILVTTGKVVTPILETAGATDTLSIQPDVTGTTVGVEFFKNVSSTPDTPKARIWGWDNQGGVQGAVYCDLSINNFGVLRFDGTYDSVLFVKNLKIPDNYSYQLGNYPDFQLRYDSGNDWLELYSARKTGGAGDMLHVNIAGDFDFQAGDLTTTGTVTGGGAKCQMTPIGGYAVKLTNETGFATVAGQLVKADTATNDAVILAAAGDTECIGVFLDSGVADAAEAWVVVAGIADVALDDDVAAVRGNWMATGVLAGYAATSASPAAAPTHFEEIGHCIESVTAGGGGTHILARCVLHFN